jgi:hypothetical protein
MSESLVRPDNELQWGQKPYVGCTMAMVHQYMTLPVQVTCHLGTI